MPPTSTTPADNSADSTAGATTEQTPTTTGTDTQPVNTDNNLDASKSTDSAADGDKSTTTTDTNTEDTPTSVKLDEDIDDWAEKRFGVKPTTDEQRKAYQETRNEQREFTKARQAEAEAAKTKELADEIKNSKPEKSSDDDEDVDPLERKVRELEERDNAREVTRLQSEFYQSNKVTEAEGKVIVEIFREKVAAATSPEAKQRAFDVWSSPESLPDLLEIAKARIASGNASVIADEAAKKEGERIAKESQANSPGRGAKSPTSGAKTPEQQRLERFSKWD